MKFVDGWLKVSQEAQDIFSRMAAQTSLKEVLNFLFAHFCDQVPRTFTIVEVFCTDTSVNKIEDNSSQRMRKVSMYDMT